MSEIRFVVEEAGCESCAARVRAALAPIAAVSEIAVDEAGDEAVVVLAHDSELTPEAVGQALARASEGAGHAYRVRPGSWSVGGSS